MLSFEEIISVFPSKRVLVVGDVMLDRFVYGNVVRISPEAPAMVLNAGTPQNALGGAGNVARNIVGLGASCDLLGVVGADDSADILADMIQAAGVSSHLVVDAGRHTSLKMRFVAHMHNTHLLRADWEDTVPLENDVERELLERFVVLAAACDIVVLSDYLKGVLSPRVLSAVMATCVELGKSTVVDPKGINFAKYRGITAMTPNIAEVRAAIGYAVPNDDDSLLSAARHLIEVTGSEAVLVTRSERGVLVAGRDGSSDVFGATAARVIDVSGAGDTLVGSFALAIASGATLRNAAQLANIAAGLAVAKLGTSVVTIDELRGMLLSRPHFDLDDKILLEPALMTQIEKWRSAGLAVGFTNGCFDLLHSGHIHMLRQARDKCDRLIVALNSDASVGRLKGPSRPVQDEQARATVIAAIAFVDAVIVFDSDTPLDLIHKIRPDVLIKGADYTVDQVVGREIVERSGGRVLIAHLVPGRSTSALVARLKNGAGLEGSPVPGSLRSTDTYSSVLIRLGKRARWLSDGNSRPTLFLDRAGVIIKDEGHASRPSGVDLHPGVASAIREANTLGIPVVVVSNQSGVSRGLFSWEDVVSIDNRIAQRLEAEGAALDAVFYSGAADSSEADARWFRKPSPGLLLMASQLISADMSKSVIVGDSVSDVIAAASAGLPSGFLVDCRHVGEDLIRVGQEFPAFEVLQFSNAAEAMAKATAMLALLRLGGPALG